MRQFEGTYASPLGRLQVAGLGARISRIALITAGCKAPKGALPPEVRRSLDAYFKGKPPRLKGRFAMRGTPLQRKVWGALETIPWGECISYAELARRVKKPRAVRAVAGAVGKNPVAILVPCHRVIASDGGLGGYAYGLRKKKWLLRHEGIQRG